MTGFDMSKEYFDEYGAPTEALLGRAFPPEFDGPVKREPLFRILEWGVDRYRGDAPDIDWLIEGILPSETPGMVCSLGGVGKSYLMMDLCVRLAAGPGLGPSFAMGGRIPRRGRAVMITAEDSSKALHRRLDQILLDSEKEKLRDWLYIVPLADHQGQKSLMAVHGGDYVRSSSFPRCLEASICWCLTRCRPWSWLTLIPTRLQRLHSGLRSRAFVLKSNALAW